jgi:t-SNARE complex subunit (syntaxin)
MVDVLSQLRRGGGPPVVAPAVSADDPFAPFWSKYNSIQGKIGSIELEIDAVRRIDEELRGSSDNMRQAQLRDELNGKLRSISQNADVIRRDLEGLRTAIEQLDDQEPNSPEVRMQKNHMQLLNTAFEKTVNNFAELQREIKTNFVKTFARQCRITGATIDEQQVERIVQENPQALQQNLFQLQGGAQTFEITEVYNQIAGRHQDILRIETQVNEILDLFVQFAILVREQGRMIDNIEQNISTAHDYVERGVEALEQAKEHQKSSRKCLWCMVVIGIILLVVVVVVSVVATQV